MWHCPHCGTPQAETARCWVCRRSSTTCSTCRHFRRAVAAGIGYCGLDRSRRPLHGSEIRGCWQGLPAMLDPAPLVTPRPIARLRGFVPLDGPAMEVERPSPDVVPASMPAVVEPRDPGTLFDLEA